MKTYELLDPEIYFAIGRYCKQKNIRFAGHVPVGVTVEEASQSGMRSIEHLTGISKAFSSGEDSLNLVISKEALEIHGFEGPHGMQEVFSHNEDFAIPFDQAKAEKVCNVLVANHTAVDPTLSIYRGYYFSRDSLKKLPEMVYVSKEGYDYWYNISNKSASEQRYLAREMKNLLFLYQHGVLILAGTDAPNPYVVHGFSLHNELEWYVDAGLPILAALQTATINPARFLNKENEMGTVSKNKFADLVILNSNPLTDIKNTRDIYAVIANGKHLDRKRLDFLLQHISDY
ncbi:MAG TPA: amidohydrolase family protein, partial [Chitinophagaceae bacterium]